MKLGWMTSLMLFTSVLSYAEEYQAKNFDYLLGTVSGIDDALLKMHFTLYKGYVTNTNKLIAELEAMQTEGKMRTPDFAGLKRIFGWEFDGMRLHEYYFENLGGKGATLDPKSSLYQELEKEFGSFDKWKENFVATGLMRGIGWVILYRDPHTGRLMNVWINEHDEGHLAGANPILIMDVWEHAYLTQFGLDRAAYITAFMNNINWDVVQKRG